MWICNAWCDFHRCWISQCLMLQVDVQRFCKQEKKVFFVKEPIDNCRKDYFVSVYILKQYLNKVQHSLACLYFLWRVHKLFIKNKILEIYILVYIVKIWNQNMMFWNYQSISYVFSLLIMTYSIQIYSPTMSWEFKQQFWKSFPPEHSCDDSFLNMCGAVE